MRYFMRLCLSLSIKTMLIPCVILPDNALNASRNILRPLLRTCAFP